MLNRDSGNIIELSLYSLNFHDTSQKVFTFKSKQKNCMKKVAYPGPFKATSDLRDSHT